MFVVLVKAAAAHKLCQIGARAGQNGAQNGIEAPVCKGSERICLEAEATSALIIMTRHYLVASVGGHYLLFGALLLNHFFRTNTHHIMPLTNTRRVAGCAATTAAAAADTATLVTYSEAQNKLHGFSQNSQRLNVQLFPFQPQFQAHFHFRLRSKTELFTCTRSRQLAK